MEKGDRSSLLISLSTAYIWYWMLDLIFIFATKLAFFDFVFELIFDYIEHEQQSVYTVNIQEKNKI